MHVEQWLKLNLNSAALFLVSYHVYQGSWIPVIRINWERKEGNTQDRFSVAYKTAGTSMLATSI